MYIFHISSHDFRVQFLPSERTIFQPYGTSGALLFLVKPVIRMEAGDYDSDDTCGDEETQTISLDEESDDDSNAEGDSECESDEDTVTKRKSPALAVPKKKAKINPDADGSVPSTSTANTTKKVTATQRITVCNKRNSYTTYPAYLFDVPPNDLAIDNLCRQYLIAEIEGPRNRIYFMIMPFLLWDLPRKQ